MCPTKELCGIHCFIHMRIRISIIKIILEQARAIEYPYRLDLRVFRATTTLMILTSYDRVNTPVGYTVAWGNATV